MARSTSRPKSVTLADVARFAGVSSAVVSYVVNDGPRPVAPDTAMRVREAIATLGYRPNTQARALTTGSTGILGLIHPGTANPFFGEFSDIVYDTATGSKRALITACSAGRADEERVLIERLAGRNVDGIIVLTSMTPADVSRISNPGIPMVFVNCPFPVPGFRSIGPDGQQGARDLVAHLLTTHGHSSVALVIGDTGAPDPEDREVGWREAHRIHGRTPGVVARTAFSIDGAYDAVRELMQLPDAPTAVFVSSDQQAFGALHAIHDSGRHIPDDVAVVSFDGISESAHTWPPLTVAKQPVLEMATTAISELLAGAPPTHTLFPTHLIIRRSCGCSSRSDPDL